MSCNKYNLLILTLAISAVSSLQLGHFARADVFRKVSPEKVHSQAFRQIGSGTYRTQGRAATSVACSMASNAGRVPLKNPGFESNVLHEGWSLHGSGARPRLALDTTIRHEGHQSLRISATEPSDTALSQDIKLRPGRLYRLTVWIRTRNLDPHGAPLYGTFQIQRPNGEFVAQDRNHRDNTEWTQERILFCAPPDGQVRLAPFFIGFGKGTGTAWFDDIRLEQIRSMEASVRVRRDVIGDSEINPFQYGQFIEPLGDHIPGMWAERLSNASFEGVNRCNLTFRKEKDFSEKLWYPIGAVNRGDYALDEDNPFNGRISQRIRAEGEPCTLGIAQDGIFVQRGKAYKLSVYLRQKNLPGPVRTYLRAPGEVLAEAEFRPKLNWQKYTTCLFASATTADATFALDFRGPGTVWIDQVSLMPEDTVGGWRPDVVKAVKALKPRIIRWGGSTIERYDWRNLIGDPDRRVPWHNHPWGGMHPTGAGLEEFVQLCRAVDAEPLICVRVSDKEPAEGAAQVEYFNGGPDTPMGRLRAENGHTKPYKVKYWQVGNEVRGNAQRLAAFCAAMKAADPSIKLLSSYPDADVVREAGKYLDYLCPHHYGLPDLARRAGDFETVRRWAAEHAPGQGLKIAVTEWDFARWSGRARGLSRATLWSLDNALLCSLYHNLLHRYGHLVEIAIRSNLTNSGCAGIIQTNNATLYKTPTYYAEQLYSHHAGTHPLKVELDGDLMQDEVSATLSRNGKTVVLFVVNAMRLERKVTIDLSEFGPMEKRLSIWTLMDTQKAGERDVANSFYEPERVRPVTSTISIKRPKFNYTFPPLTLTVLKCRIRR